jgi:uncharacterized protein YaaN involved in tellurite resistance
MTTDTDSQKAGLPTTLEVVPADMAMVPSLEVNLVASSAQNRPQWLTPEMETEVRTGVVKFMELIRQNPTDISLSTKVYSLGQDGAKELMPHTALYERKIKTIMSENQTGSPANKTLLQLKQELDQVNPAVLSKLPISVKGFLWMKDNRLPMAQEILDMIYAKRETVQSTVDGIKASLWETRDRLITNLADIGSIYKGLEKGQRLIQRDIYFGELLSEDLSALVAQTTEVLAVQNLEQVLADLTTSVINLKTEENANMQFFSGAINLAKLTNMQCSNITSVTNILERSVLANLGLRVVASELAASVAAVEQLKHTIGETIADTGRIINKTTDIMIEAKASASISIEGLEEGCRQLDEAFNKQAAANHQIIELGTQTSHKLSDLTARMRSRIETNGIANNGIGAIAQLPTL